MTVVARTVGHLAVAALLALGSAGQARSAENLSIVTGPVGGTMYAISSSITDLVNRNLKDLRLSNTAGGGSIYTLKVLANNEADFAMAGNDVSLDALKGAGSFDGKAFPEVRGVTALFSEAFHVVVRADSAIKSFDDLKGKRIAVGPPASGTGLASSRLLPLLGLPPDSYRKLELGFQESADYLRDGNVDAVVYQVGLPYGPVVDVSISRPVRVLPIPEQSIRRIQEAFPFYVPVMVPQDTYRGMTASANAVAVKMLLLTTTRASDGAVYETVRQIYDNLPVVRASHQAGQSISLEKALDGMTVPLHPAATRFYKERGLIK